MDSIKDVVFTHYSKYPKMQIEDYVKLLFQNEFAGGHLINDKESSLNYIKEEGKKYPLQTEDFFVDIGNNLCRFHFSDGMLKLLSPEIINNAFIMESNKNKGSVEQFEAKLSVLLSMSRENVLPIEFVQLENYIEKYRNENYPAVSHSDIYRNEYSPHYRVLGIEFKKYFPIISEIIEKGKDKSKLLVAIDGKSGSGKSSCAKYLEELFCCNVFHTDDFFLLPEHRTEERLNEIGGNVEYERINQQIIGNLQMGKKFRYEKYNCQTSETVISPEVCPGRVNIIEGVYSMHPLYRKAYDCKIFMTVDIEIQRQRILNRNGHEMLKRFEKEWIPLENRYFHESCITDECDVILDSSWK